MAGEINVGVGGSDATQQVINRQLQTIQDAYAASQTTVDQPFQVAANTPAQLAGTFQGLNTIANSLTQGMRRDQANEKAQGEAAYKRGLMTLEQAYNKAGREDDFEKQKQILKLREVADGNLLNAKQQNAIELEGIRSENNAALQESNNAARMEQVLAGKTAPKTQLREINGKIYAINPDNTGTEVVLDGMTQTQRDAATFGEKQYNTNLDQFNVLSEAATHVGRENATGIDSNFKTIAGSDAANYESLFNQFQGQIFLEGYDQLRGGGHITNVEGQQAKNAAANLSLSQSDDEHLKNLALLTNVRLKGLNSYNAANGIELVEEPKWLVDYNTKNPDAFAVPESYKNAKTEGTKDSPNGNFIDSLSDDVQSRLKRY